MILSAKIVPHIEIPLATQMQHFVSGCVSVGGELLAGSCNVKMDPIISSLLNIVEYHQGIFQEKRMFLIALGLGSRQL